jgi:hypothetical protein
VAADILRVGFFDFYYGVLVLGAAMVLVGFLNLFGGLFC